MRLGADEDVSKEAMIVAPSKKACVPAPESGMAGSSEVPLPALIASFARLDAQEQKMVALVPLTSSNKHA